MADKFEVVVVPLDDNGKWPDVPSWIGVAKGDSDLLTYVLVPSDLVGSLLHAYDDDRSAPPTTKQATKRCEDMKPCPFCGNEPYIGKSRGRCYVQCRNHYTEPFGYVMLYGSTMDDAIARWNRRASDSVQVDNGAQ